MADTQFGVKYDGSALAEGRMAVRDLAPALLAMGELFTEASLVAYPDRDPVSLHIKATERGSFAVELSLNSPAAWNQIRQFLIGPTVQALLNLQGIIFGTGGLLWLIKAIGGQPIAKTEPLEGGMVRIALPDGTTIEGAAEAVALYERQSARESVEEIVEPLRRPGVERVTFSDDHKNAFTIEQDDLPLYQVPVVSDEVLSEREEESIVTVATASFAEAYKWRFSEGDITFTATIDDRAFRARIDAGEAFRKGDMLRVLLHKVQSQRGNKLHIDRTVIEVLEHYPRLMQTSIDEEAEG